MFSQLLLVFSLLPASQGTAPCMCPKNEVEVNRYTFTKVFCGCIKTKQTVDWLINGKLATWCTFSSLANKEEMCTTSKGAKGFSAERTQEAAVLTVSSGALNIDDIISCKIRETGEHTSCSVDLIYAANESSCHVEVNKDTDTVSTHCNITKVYSAKGRYTCHLYHVLQNASEQTLINTSTMSVWRRHDTDLMTGVCHVTGSVLSGGVYRVIISPGWVIVTNFTVTTVSETFTTDHPVMTTTLPTVPVTAHSVTGLSSTGATEFIDSTVANQTLSLQEMDGCATTSSRGTSGWIGGWIVAGVCGGLLVTVVGVILFCFRGRKKDPTKPTTTPNDNEGPPPPPAPPSSSTPPGRSAPQLTTASERSAPHLTTTPGRSAPHLTTTLGRSAPPMSDIFWLRFRARRVHPQVHHV